MKTAVTIAAGALLIASLAVSLRDREDSALVCKEPCAATAAPMDESHATSHVPVEQADTSLPVTALTIDQASEYEQRLAFHERVRAYFANPDALDAGQREGHARELINEVSTYEARGELSAPEAQLLKRELIRTSMDDESQKQRALDQLAAAYTAATEQRIAESKADPAFDLYKARETEVVSAVMQMQHIPDGLTRDEYLRRRLQAERERLFAESAQ